MPLSLKLREHEEGVLLPIRVQPQARRTALVGAHHGTLKVAVTAPAEQGKANAAIVELLAELLGVSRTRVQVWRGTSSREKLILVRGMSLAELHDRLTCLLCHD